MLDTIDHQIIQLLQLLTYNLRVAFWRSITRWMKMM